MAIYRVYCIRKSDRYNPWERITHIGGINPDGSRWVLTQGDAIDGIKANKWSFVVREGGREVRVQVRESRFGHEYLATEADGEHPDNLLSLPECP